MQVESILIQDKIWGRKVAKSWWQLLVPETTLLLWLCWSDVSAPTHPSNPPPHTVHMAHDHCILCLSLPLSPQQYSSPVYNSLGSGICSADGVRNAPSLGPIVCGQGLSITLHTWLLAASPGSERTLRKLLETGKAKGGVHLDKDGEQSVEPASRTRQVREAIKILPFHVPSKWSQCIMLDAPLNFADKKG